MAKAEKKSTTNSFSKFIKWFWILFLSGIAFVALIFLSTSWGLFGELPPYEYLENPQTNLASQIISSDGNLLGKFYLDDNRTDIKFDDLPENLVNTLIASEDIRFMDHSGIDARGTLRAFAFLGSKGGASTISQQLARQLFVGVRSRSKLAIPKKKL